MVVPKEPISPSGCFPGCIRTSSRNSEAADSDVFMHSIYKHQFPQMEFLEVKAFLVPAARTCQIACTSTNSSRNYNPKSEKVGTVWKTQIKKESSDF